MKKGKKLWSAPVFYGINFTEGSGKGPGGPAEGHSANHSCPTTFGAAFLVNGSSVIHLKGGGSYAQHASGVPVFAPFVVWASCYTTDMALTGPS